MTEIDTVREALTRYLDVDIAADKWDEPPSLALILRDKTGVISFDPVPIGGAWGAGPVYQVVWAAGDTAKQLREIYPNWSLTETGESLIGIVLFSEGWGMSAEGPSASERLMDWVRAGNRDHPDRVEVKMVSAVLTDGQTVTMTHARGGTTESRPEQAEGRIPEALQYALTAFQGVTP